MGCQLFSTCGSQVPNLYKICISLVDHPSRVSFLHHFWFSGAISSSWGVRETYVVGTWLLTYIHFAARDLQKPPPPPIPSLSLPLTPYYKMWDFKTESDLYISGLNEWFQRSFLSANIRNLIMSKHHIKSCKVDVPRVDTLLFATTSRTIWISTQLLRARRLRSGFKSCP